MEKRVTLGDVVAFFNQMDKDLADEHGVEAYEESGGGISYKPAPATGEWTRDDVYHNGVWKRADEIVDAHNAALTAERVHQAAAQTVNEGLRGQLQAEREERLKEKKLKLGWEESWRKLREQLRRKLDESEQQRRVLAEQIENEIAWHVAEAVKPYREALEMLRTYQNGCPLPSYEKGWTEAMRLTDALLAQEGK